MKTEKIGDVVVTKGFFESTQKFQERVRQAKAQCEFERLKKFKDKVMELRKRMPSQDEYREWLLFSVDFFQVFSDEQDHGLYWHLPESEDKALINKCIRNGGREEYGINRTRRWEKVTIDNVYWGNLEMYGCRTKTVRKYLESIQEAEDVLCEAEAEKVVRLQVIPFIMSYLEGPFIKALWRLTSEEVPFVEVSK